MGSDHYLYLHKGYKKIEREDLDITMVSVQKRDKNQYEKSLEKVADCEAENRWCSWDKSYIEEYEKYEAHKDDEYVGIELAYYGKHWNLSSLVLQMVRKYVEGRGDIKFVSFEYIELTKEMVEEMYKLHVEHFEGKNTLRDICADDWHEDKEWKLEYSMQDLKYILEDGVVNWEDDAIYYEES